MPVESPPDGLFTHLRPSEVDINDVDTELREFFEIVKETPGIHTTLLCQGHPESEDIYVWGTSINIRLVYHTDYIIPIEDFRRLLIHDVPGELEGLPHSSTITTFVAGTCRNQDTSWEYISLDEFENWVGVDLQYDYSTIGQRRAFIRVLEEAFKEVFW